MNWTAIAFGLVGAAAVGWGGSALESRLSVTGWNADLVIFAIGVILLGQFPAVVDRARIRRLEAEVAALRGDASAT